MVGFDEQVRRERRGSYLGTVLGGGCLACLAAVCVVALRVAIGDLREQWTGGAMPRIVFFGVVLLFLSAIARELVKGLFAKPRIVPYFRDPLNSQKETCAAFRGGFRLAADLAQLDDWARTAGVQPLSAFGFSDDYHKQEPIWGDPAEGLRTLSALKKHLDQNATGSSSPTAQELDALSTVLGKALERGTPFSLIVRLGRDSYVSGVEISRRQGSFW